MPLPAKFTRLLSSLSTDLEKGQNHQNGSTSSPMPTIDRDAMVQASLNDFRFAVGIHNSVDMNAGRPIPNIGIYQRVCKTENKYKKQFQWFSWMINGALGLQIIFAAALTALGAGNGPRSAVTAFGAMNTIIAGFLTYLKGSGLPNRLKYYKDEVTKVREYIEQRERELSRGDPNIDLRREISIIEDMYESMKRDIEVNTPEAYISRTKEQAHPQQLDVGRYPSGAKREIDDRMYNLNEKFGASRRDIEDRMYQSRIGTESGLRSLTADINGRLSGARQGLTSQLSQGRLEAEGRLRGMKDEIDDRYGKSRDELDTRYNTVRNDIDNAMTTVRHDADDRLNRTRHDLDERYENTRHDLDDRVTQERQGLETRFSETRAGVESQIDAARVATAAQVENTRHGLETRMEDTRAGISAQVEDTRHGMESRMKEVQAQVKEQEEKIMGIAEKVASKVLAVTQKRHEDDHKS